MLFTAQTEHAMFKLSSLESRFNKQNHMIKFIRHNDTDNTYTSKYKMKKMKKENVNVHENTKETYVKTGY